MTNELQSNASMIIYNDGELELNVSVENETIWLTQKQIAALFSLEVLLSHLCTC